VQRTRVLIVDDHETVRQALEARLRAAEGVEVVGSTGSWQEAVRLSMHYTPDVILLETKRSDSQGMTALRELRAGCSSTCIIVLTSYPDAEERREAIQAGAVRYLLKDIGSISLVQEIQAVAHPRAPI